MDKPESKESTAGGPVARLPEPVKTAVDAALGKKASDVIVLDLRRVGAFTDYFLLCSGQNPRQVQAIADAVEGALGRSRRLPSHTEGRRHAEWVLMDFFDFVVHIFTPEKRLFYSLERLWGSAERIPVQADERT